MITIVVSGGLDEEKGRKSEKESNSNYSFRRAGEAGEQQASRVIVVLSPYEGCVRFGKNKGFRLKLPALLPLVICLVPATSPPLERLFGTKQVCTAPPLTSA